MIDRMNKFPKLAQAPGRFAAEWLMNGKWIAGELQLEGKRPPIVAVFGDVASINPSDGGVREFPQDHQLGRLVGRLRSNDDVVVADANVSTLFPGSGLGHGRYAIVGLDVASIPDDRYEHVRLQITGADLLFGVAPLREIQWPREGMPYPAGQYAAVVNADSSHVWSDAGIELTCSYDLEFPLTNPYRYELKFAPVVDIKSPTPLTLDEWIATWIRPLLGVTALATRGPQRLAWLSVHTLGAAHEQQPSLQTRETSGVVFGGGIEQAPYEAEYPQELMRADSRPLFTLASIPISLPRLLRDWRDLESGENPFVELYRLVLFQPDLPRRARFLYLIQALEALHGYQNRRRDDEAQLRFGLRRAAVLEAIRHLDLDSKSYRFVREKWSRRRPDSLDRRLEALLKALPVNVAADLVRADMVKIEAELVGLDNRSLAAQLRTLRNQLSHGGRNYQESELSPWVRTVETLSRAHLLRMLGFDDVAIERALLQG
jgi:hypothetical protein